MSRWKQIFIMFSIMKKDFVKPADVAKLTGMPPTTTYRIINSMKKEQLLDVRRDFNKGMKGSLYKIKTNEGFD